MCIYIYVCVCTMLRRRPRGASGVPTRGGTCHTTTNTIQLQYTNCLQQLYNYNYYYTTTIQLLYTMANTHTTTTTNTNSPTTKNDEQPKLLQLLKVDFRNFVVFYWAETLAH